jgi:hypothetical protein
VTEIVKDWNGIGYAIDSEGARCVNKRVHGYQRCRNEKSLRPRYGRMAGVRYVSI